MSECIILLQATDCFVGGEIDIYYEELCVNFVFSGPF